MAAPAYTPQEMMVIAAARRLRDTERVFVGVGLPNLACSLAMRRQAPRLVMIYESGVVGARPPRVPLSIGDPMLVSGSLAVMPMMDVFTTVLQRGWVDTAFLGGAQIDRYGNLNSTVIGDYRRPTVRLAGSGGATDIAALARRVLVLMPHQPRRLPARVDFITCPGFPPGGGRAAREAMGLPGGGPETVITDLGLLEAGDDGELMLVSIHPGVAVEAVLARTGWPLRLRDPLEVTDPPTAEELRLLREELDAEGVYLRRGE